MGITHDVVELMKDIPENQSRVWICHCDLHIGPVSILFNRKVVGDFAVKRAVLNESTGTFCFVEVAKDVMGFFMHEKPHERNKTLLRRRKVPDDVAVVVDRHFSSACPCRGRGAFSAEHIDPAGRPSSHHHGCTQIVQVRFEFLGLVDLYFGDIGFNLLGKLSHPFPNFGIETHFDSFLIKR